jgi:hypothetical protein
MSILFLKGYPFPLDDTPLLQRTVPLKVRYMEHDSIREARFGEVK